MRIANNITAMTTHRQYGINNDKVARSSEKLSSGYRINRAGDDAAGLAISEKMRAQIRGLNMASKNSQDAISLVQTAEGALKEVHSMLQRMNELAVQSATDTNEGIDRNALQAEFSNLQKEIDQIASTTKFNNKQLLDGQLGIGTTGDKKTVTGAVVAANGLVAGAEVKLSGVEEGVSVSFATAVQAAGTSVTAAWNSATKTLAFTIGSQAAATISQSQIDAAIKNATGVPESVANNMKVEVTGLATAGATAANAAVATSTLTASEAVQASTSFNGANALAGNTFKVTMDKAGTNARTITFAAAGNEGATVNAAGNVAINFQSGKKYSANDVNEMLKAAGAGMTVSFDGEVTGADLAGADAFDAAAITVGAGGDAAVLGRGLSDGGSLKIQVGAEEGQTLDISIAAMNTKGLGVALSDVRIGTQPSASKSISAVRDAINTVSTQMSELGAMQNRLEHKIANLDVSAENLSAAESRIRDVDIAKEMTTFTKNGILSQAATAMLAQANAAPQQVLTLLR